MARPVKIIQPADSLVLSKPPEDWMTECFPYEEDIRATTVAQLHALLRQLDRICQTVQPDKDTLKVAFGHDIRNLLILACTEVESYWRGVLVANGAPGNQYNTEDYVVLQQAMRLGEYKVSFPAYPRLDPIKPFDDWVSGRASKSLPWYHAYNHVKHNREDCFKMATLARAFEAVTACVIVAAAQFGIPRMVQDQPEIKAFFHFLEVPSWREEDYYSWDPTQFPVPYVPTVVPGQPRPSHSNWQAVDFSEIKMVAQRRKRGKE
jgi:hypothetical protein